MAQIILSATTFLLLLSLSTPSTTATTTTIFDTDGRPLRTNSAYYILPILRGGGLTMTPINTTTPCPLYVSQENPNLSNGLPLKFFPLNPKQKTISHSSDLNIVFDAAITCVQSTGWAVTFDEGTGTRYIGTGGTIGNPVIDTLNSWFHIVKIGNGMYDYSYKISFCPGVCPECTMMCGDNVDVGVMIGKHGTKFLGLTNQALVVRFKKA
ncbi:Miraculin [Bienertia sinuspersici]